MGNIIMRNIVITVLAFLFFLPLLTFAQETSYRPLTPFLIEGNFDTDASAIENLVNNLYALSITLAALLAVIKIIIGGVKWMMSDIVTSKEDAKKDIRTAVIGLLIVISAVLILTIINPQTATINFNLTPMDLSSRPEAPPPPNTVPGLVCESDTCFAEINNCKEPGGVFRNGGVVTAYTGSTFDCTENLSLSLRIVCVEQDCSAERIRCNFAGGTFPTGGTVTDFSDSIVPFVSSTIDCLERDSESEPQEVVTTLICDTEDDLTSGTCDDAEAICFADFDGVFEITIIPEPDTSGPLWFSNAVVGEGTCTYNS
jgi:hypothetical protein